MWNERKSLILSLAVCFSALAVAVLALLFLPVMLELFFYTYTKTDPEGAAAIIQNALICLYPCVVIAISALVMLIKMLFNIYNGKVFIKNNITCLRIISWCCIAVALIAVYGGIKYMPFFFIAAAAAFVAIILRVVKNVMQHAVEIREENDLVI